MNVFMDKAHKEIVETYGKYKDDVLKAEKLYNETLGALSHNGETSSYGTEDEGIINYNHMYFIMCWIRFESFIKVVATDLFQCKADKILMLDALEKDNNHIRKSLKSKCKAIQGKTKSINELFVQTNGFSSISALKESVFIDIADEASKGQSDISIYLSFIRLFISDEDKEPYNCTYEFEGKVKPCDYNLVNAIREIRNTLVHDGGKIKEEKRKTIMKLKDFEDNVIKIDIQTLAEIRAILYSVARNIFEITTKTIVEDKEKEEYQKMLRDREFYTDSIHQCEKEMAELKEELDLLRDALFAVERDIEDYERYQIEKFFPTDDYSSEEINVPPPDYPDYFETIDDIPPEESEPFNYTDFLPDE